MLAATAAASIVLSILLAALLTLSAFIKYTRREPFVQGYARVGVPEARLNQLAVILLTGAGGLVLGLWWPPIGIAAASGVMCYFLLAILFHIRAGDARNLGPPTVLVLLAAATLVLRIMAV